MLLPTRLAAVSLCCVVGLAGVAGCPRNEPGGEAQPPLAGRKLEIAVPAGLVLSEAWQPVVAEWSHQTGADYDLREYRLAQTEGTSGGASLVDRLGFGTGSQANPPATLFVFPTNRIGELAAENLLASIPAGAQAQDRLDWSDFFQGLREGVARIESRPAFIPLSCPVLVCYYRPDLLARAGLSPPKTWDDYQKLLDGLEQWAPGLSAVEPWGADFRATMFLARAVSYAKSPGNYSLFFDIQTGEPLIGGPGFVRALEQAQRALEKMPPDVKNYSPRECRRELLAGRAALTVAFETGPGEPELPFLPGAGTSTEPAMRASDHPRGGRPPMMAVGFERLPGTGVVFNHSYGEWIDLSRGQPNQVTLTAFGGISIGVSAGADPADQEAAWNLVTRLAGAEADLDTTFPAAAKGLCRETQLLHAAAWVSRELTAREAGEYAVAVAESLRDQQTVAELPVVGREEFRAALTAGLDRVLAGEASPQEALRAVSARWSEIAERIGRRKVLDSYRRSLGLFPRATN